MFCFLIVYFYVSNNLFIDKHCTIEAAIEAECEKWRKAVHDGFAAHGTEGSAFQRAKDGASSAGYKACDTRAMKGDYRKRWAQTRLQNAMAEKEKSEVLAHEDISNGTYRSFTWLAKNEGMSRSTKYCKKCLALGEPWVKWNVMWEEYYYLNMEVSFKDVFAKAWTLKAKEIEKHGINLDGDDADARVNAPPVAKCTGSEPVEPTRTTGGEATSPPAEADAAAGGKAKPPAPPKSKKRGKVAEPVGKQKKAKKGTGEGGATGGSKDTPKVAKDMPIKTAAQKFLNEYSSSTSGAANIQKIIASSESWIWARNPVHQEQLKAAEATVNKCLSQNSFAAEFFTSELKDVIKHHGDRFPADFTRLRNELQPKLKELRVETQSLILENIAKQKRHARQRRSVSRTLDSGEHNVLGA